MRWLLDHLLVTVDPNIAVMRWLIEPFHADPTRKHYLDRADRINEGSVSAPRDLDYAMVEMEIPGMICSMRAVF